MRNFFTGFFLILITISALGQEVHSPIKISENKIKIDGIIDPVEWEGSIKIELDNETEPGYNIKPIVSTNGYILYSDYHVYLRFEAETKETVRASIRKRDDNGIFNDDIVGFDIDTYGDGRNNLFIGSNAYGSQVDVRVMNALQEESRYDMSFDLEYESAGSISGNSYIVEMKIPFSSLPFPNGKDQKWKFSFFRKYNDYQISSSKSDRDNSCITCQFDDEVFFENIKIDKKLDLIPYISSGIEGAYNQNTDNIEYEKINSNIGVSINTELSKSLSLELAINPDFSQVEADVTQIDVNSAFSLSYPEKRPFFNKGTDILKLNNPDLQPFYSRSINDPAFALKLLNQGKKSRLFYLSSIDSNSPYLIAGRDRSYFGEGKKSFVNVLRYQRLLKNGSKIGLISTSRAYNGGGYGNLFGLDGLIQITNSIRLTFDLLKNYNEEPKNDWIDSDDYFNEYSVRLDGEKFNGNGLFIGLSRNTENWRTYLGYKYIDPEYRADVGFAVKNDRKWLTYYQSYKSFYEKRFIQNLEYSIKYDMLHDFNNKLDVISLDGKISAGFKGNTEFSITHDYDFVSYYLDKKYSNYGSTRIGLNTSPIELISFRSNISFGKDVAFNDEDPGLGKEFNLRATLSVQVNDNFSISNLFSFSKLKKIEINEFYYKGFINRFNTKYQFSKSLGLRLATEYNDFSESIFLQPLFEWTPNPFTIFYIGGNQILNKDDKYFVDRSQMFVKFQYLISI
ncbi:MAG: hypothetical protein CND83_01565 [Rhodothermaeota bacterium MED-G19]|nr:MAG: hypothetical protein CND83_01565 [Rhodothermaeota bacterium MED-G19]